MKTRWVRFSVLKMLILTSNELKVRYIVIVAVFLPRKDSVIVEIMFHIELLSYDVVHLLCKRSFSDYLNEVFVFELKHKLVNRNW